MSSATSQSQVFACAEVCQVLLDQINSHAHHKHNIYRAWPNHRRQDSMRCHLHENDPHPVKQTYLFSSYVYTKPV